MSDKTVKNRKEEGRQRRRRKEVAYTWKKLYDDERSPVTGRLLLQFLLEELTDGNCNVNERLIQ